MRTSAPNDIATEPLIWLLQGGAQGGVAARAGHLLECLVEVEVEVEVEVGAGDRARAGEGRCLRFGLHGPRAPDRA